jgi:hypothetical protein
MRGTKIKMLTYVAISINRNVIMKKADKILKYEDLTTEIQCKWNVRAKVIPTLKGATGIISKSFTQYPRNIPGKHKFKELQTTVTLGTAQPLWKVVMQKYKITLHAPQTVNT